MEIKFDATGAGFRGWEWGDENDGILSMVFDRISLSAANLVVDDLMSDGSFVEFRPDGLVICLGTDMWFVISIPTDEWVGLLAEMDVVYDEGDSALALGVAEKLEKAAASIRNTVARRAKEH